MVTQEIDEVLEQVTFLQLSKYKINKHDNTSAKIGRSLWDLSTAMPRKLRSEINLSSNYTDSMQNEMCELQTFKLNSIPSYKEMRSRATGRGNNGK